MMRQAQKLALEVKWSGIINTLWLALTSGAVVTCDSRRVATGHTAFLEFLVTHTGERDCLQVFLIHLSYVSIEIPGHVPPVGR